MNGPISLGHSVKLIQVSELASQIFKVSERRVRTLLDRLEVPIAEDYGNLGPVVLQSALEAAIFRDLFIRREGHKLPEEAARTYQALAACDFCILDRAALQTRLRKFALALMKDGQLPIIRHPRGSLTPKEKTS